MLTCVLGIACRLLFSSQVSAMGTSRHPLKIMTFFSMRSLHLEMLPWCLSLQHC